VYDLDTGELLTGPPGDSFGPDSRVQPFEYGISSIGETKLYALGLAGVWNRANDYYADTLKENGIKNRDVSISYDGDQVLYKKINDEYYQKMKNDPELMNLIRDAVPGLYADLMKYKPSSSKA
jgi:hypothetical protein